MRGILSLLITLSIFLFGFTTNPHKDSVVFEIEKHINEALRDDSLMANDIHSILISKKGEVIYSKYFNRYTAKFHAMLNGNDSLDYYYEAGTPRVKVINKTTALAYYSWKMFWYKRHVPTDTTYKEIGLMSLTARKMNGAWKWIAVTNQHTPWFYDSIDPVKFD